MLEKDIEKRVCDYAKAKGFLVYKFVSPGHAFVPDRMFVHPSGYIAFIEFKSEKGRTTAGQEREHDRLLGHNVKVYVCNNVELGKWQIDEMASFGEMRVRPRLDLSPTIHRAPEPPPFPFAPVLGGGDAEQVPR